MKLTSRPTRKQPGSNQVLTTIEEGKKLRREEREGADAPPLSLIPPEPESTLAGKARALDRAGVEELRQATGRKLHFGGDESLKLCEALARDGRTVEQMRAVVRAKAAEWGNDPKMRHQLKQSVLFQRKKFSRYLEEDVPTHEAGGFSQRGGRYYRVTGDEEYPDGVAEDF